MRYVIPWSDGLEGLVMCAVSCGDRVRYVILTVYSAPDDGRKVRLKHVVLTRNK